MEKGLGYRRPTDRIHIERYPFMMTLTSTSFVAEKAIPVPTWCRTRYDQGSLSACVGYSFSKLLSVINELEIRRSTTPTKPYKHEYDARWLWDRAKEVDEWSDTNPSDNEGTSLRAALDILKSLGHRRVLRRPDPDVIEEADTEHGILEFRWATKVDDIRACVSLGIPVVFGMDWWSTFDTPELLTNKEYWIARNTDALGHFRGGHAIMAHRVSDRRQAVGLHNTWGTSYPTVVWMPYTYIEQELNKGLMETAIITDRVVETYSNE